MIKKPTTIHEQISMIIDKGQPTEWLLQLLALTDIVHDGTLVGIVEQTQKSQNDNGWLRPATMERWQTPEIFVDKRTAIIEHCLRVNAFGNLEPERVHVD